MARLNPKAINKKKQLKVEATKEGKTVPKLLADKHRSSRFSNALKIWEVNKRLRAMNRAIQEAILEGLSEEALPENLNAKGIRTRAVHCTFSGSYTVIKITDH